MNNKKYFFPAITGWALLVVFALFIITKGAWNPATANPPGSNALAPVNVGASNQTKSGALTVSGAFVASNTATFQSPVTVTPLADSETLFKITNATGTEFFKINSVNNTSTLSAGGTSLSLGATGASLNGLNVASSTMTFGITPGNKFGIGIAPTSDNLEIAGSVKSSGNIASTTGFCIGASCITEWPTGGSGDGVPATGMILSSISNNAALIAEGYTQWVHPMGPAYQVMATNPMGNTVLYPYIKN